MSRTGQKRRNLILRILQSYQDNFHVKPQKCWSKDYARQESYRKDAWWQIYRLAVSRDVDPATTPCIAIDTYDAMYEAAQTPQVRFLCFVKRNEAKEIDHYLKERLKEGFRYGE